MASQSSSAQAEPGPAQGRARLAQLGPWRLLLCAFLLCYLAGQLAWMQANDDLDGPTAPDHLNISADWLNTTLAIVEHGEGAGAIAWDLVAQLNGLTSLMSGWPPLVHAWSASFGLLTGALSGRYARYTVFSNVGFLAVLVIALVLAMRRLQPRGRRDEGALLAVAFALLLPAVLGPMRMFGLDFPLTACVPLGVWALMDCDGFSRRGAALRFGLISGLAILVKGQYALFVAPVGLYAAGLAWFGPRGEGAQRRWRRLGNMALALMLMLGIAWIWIAGSEPAIFGSLLRHIVEAYDPALYDGPTYVGEQSEAERLSLAWFSYYLPVIYANLELGGILGLALALGILVAQRDALAPGHRHARRMLYIAAFAGPVIFSAMTGKSPRYVFPVFPIWALLFGLGLMQLAPRPRRVLAGGVLSLIAIFVIGDSTSTAFAQPRTESREGDFGDTGYAVNPPRRALTPGLAEALDARLDTLLAGTKLDGPLQVAVVAFPQTPENQNALITHAFLPGYGLKALRRCVDRGNTEAASMTVLSHTCGLSYVTFNEQPHFFEPERIGAEVHLVVALRFPEEEVNASTPPMSDRGVPYPAIALTPSMVAFEALLPPNFERVDNWRYPRVEAAAYWRPRPPAPGWSRENL